MAGAMSFYLYADMYDLFVRSTFIGWVLNGRRRDRMMVPWVLSAAADRWRGNCHHRSRQ